MQENKITPSDFTRVNNDGNGNPRYVLHYVAIQLSPDELEGLGIGNKYHAAINKARKLGGRKFHNKQYGGGIVFQSYNLQNLCNELNQRNQEATQ